MERIGRYRVDRLLGSGAFATVWLARDERLDAQVAIKLLAENWVHDDGVRRRFSDEARILWRLDSDRIVRVHLVDELDDGRPYFVMDFADGGNLETRMRERAQRVHAYGITEAVGLSIAIADGLIVAHTHGVVHRDLKPSNVMFRRSSLGGERLVLADFGIARSLEAVGATTISAGTPHYMAPEQTEGRADRRSDVYAAAVILYELLAGRVPFPYASAGQVMRAQITEVAPDLRGVRPDVPAGLAGVVATGLEADPDKRFASAEAWRAALVDHDRPRPAVDAGETLGPAELASARGVMAPLAAPPEGAPEGVAASGLPGVGAATPTAEVVAAASPVPPGLNPGPGAGPPPGPIPGPVGGPPGPPRAPRSSRRRRRLLPVLVALVAIAGIVAAISAVSAGKVSAAGEIFRDPAGSIGRLPFSGSFVPTSINPPGAPPISVPPISIPTPAAGATPASPTTASVVGTAPGLYGGTRQLSVCDAKAMVSFLEANPAKAAAWARAEGLTVDALPAYIGSLTDAILRSDTRVTNHGFANGVATAHQSVLQAGTAVLVDAFGVPRARCFCGNPLLPPVPVKATPKFTGTPWPGFDPANLTVIVAGAQATKLVLVDVRTGLPFDRPVGTHGSADAAAAPTPGTTTTAPTTTAPTTATPSTTAPPQANTDITREGSVTASSTFQGFSVNAAVDGDVTTSWFSAGNADPNGGFTLFTWRGTRDDFIGRVEIIGNEHNSNASFRTGQGYLHSDIQVLDSSGAVVFDRTFNGPGGSTPDIEATPNVVGRTVLLKLSARENPQCGGFSEIKVLAARSG